jgi:hypothetical protein
MLFADQVTQMAEGIVLLNLPKIRGGRVAIVDRIPHVPGVYSWFRSFSPPTTAAPQDFANYLIEQAEARHCLDRRGNLPPLYEVILRSRKQLSESKQASLVKLCESQHFRENISLMLHLSFLFQQPLYVGKAQDVAERIDHHLQPESKLRKRLTKVGVSLTKCWLLCVLLPDANSQTDDTCTDAAYTRSLNEDGTEQTVLSPELVVEDLLSRLFHPLFTKRYG